MKNLCARGLLGFAVGVLIVHRAVFAADVHLTSTPLAPGVSSLHERSIVDDLIAANASRTQHSGTSNYRASAPEETDAEMPAYVPPAELSKAWVLGAFGAVVAIGIGIAVTGVFLSGSRAVARW